MSRMTEQEIIELLQAYKPGDVVEWSSANSTLTKEEWEECRGGPKWDFFNHRYRLKELTPDQRKLKEAEAKVKELERRVAELEKQGGWIMWDVMEQSRCPVPSSTKVQLKFRDGEASAVKEAKYFSWYAPYIAAYRVVKEEV